MGDGRWPMFVIFSNRLGCLGSLLISGIMTLTLILLLRACTGHAVW